MDDTRSDDIRLLSVDDLSQMLGVPRATIYGWRTKREGPKALRVGRHLRYRMRDVEVWLQSRER